MIIHLYIEQAVRISNQGYYVLSNNLESHRNDDHVEMKNREWAVFAYNMSCSMLLDMTYKLCNDMVIVIRE